LTILVYLFIAGGLLFWLEGSIWSWLEKRKIIKVFLKVD